MKSSESLAQKLAYLYSEEKAATRPIDKKLAGAKLKGAVDVAYALGYGNTPFHVEMTLIDWSRENPLPAWNPTNNVERQAWEKKAREELGGQLEEIFTA